MNKTLRLVSLPFTLIALASLWGCAGSSQPARFYTLTATEPARSPAAEPQAGEPVTIGLGPVSLPDYLDRPQIVTRNGQNELSVSEFDRWAGSLRDDFSRVLAESLSASLPQVTVMSSRGGAAFDYRVTVDVVSFDDMPDGTVQMKARWRIIGRGNRAALFSGESSFSEPVQGGDYSAKVSAMSRAVSRLGMEIAGGIRAVTGKKQPG